MTSDALTNCLVEGVAPLQYPGAMKSRTRIPLRHLDRLVSAQSTPIGVTRPEDFTGLFTLFREQHRVLIDDVIGIQFQRDVRESRA